MENLTHLLSSDSSESITLHVFSDTICPWCLIGKVKLDEAIALLPAEYRIAVKWHAFQLNPDMPAGGMPRREYRAAKFGSWERSQELDAQVTMAGKEVGLEFRHDLMEFTPNTLASHRLAWWVDEEVQHALVDHLLRGYFSEGKDVGSLEVLAELAEKVGIGRKEALAFLESDKGTEEVEAESQAAQLAGISGVPAVVSDGRIIFNGAQSVDTIRRTLEHLVKEQQG